MKRALEYLGKHSLDMFLTHTFLFYLWPLTRHIIYATTNPLVIYVTLLASSLLLAVILDRMKDLTGFNRFVKLLRLKS